MSPHEDLTKIRSEVNDHRLRIHTAEMLIEQVAKVQENQNENIKDLTKSLNKLDKKFTIFIAALITSISFGEPVATALLNLIL